MPAAKRPIRRASPTGVGRAFATPRRLLGPDPLIVTPGVTLSAAAADHARPARPVDALRAGASHVVIGRALTRAPDLVAVLTAITEELRVSGPGTGSAGH